MKPVMPFEPLSTEHVSPDTNWTAQIKWDGVRVLTYYDGQDWKLYNRRLNERTHHYPELRDISAYCSARSVILDGEIIAFRDGKPSFYEVMKRDGITNLRNIKTLQARVPVNYMVFDVLYLDGDWVTSQPLSARQEMLANILHPFQSVHLVDNFDDPSGLFEVTKQQGMEGIVVKDLTSSYLINGKDGRWKKKKNYRDLIAVVGGATVKGGLVNSLLLGLYDQSGSLMYIGHAGTGRLGQKDWMELTKGIKHLIRQENPFANTPPTLRETLWVQPQLTVKVKFAEWIEGHTLRQPSIQSFVDVPPTECRL